ncbi:hypothetical protein MCEMSE15_01228 [Fimbriimonadaceae bacterium]
MTSSELRAEFIEVLNWNSTPSQRKQMLQVGEKQVSVEVISVNQGIAAAVVDISSSEEMILAERKQLSTQFRDLHREHILIFLFGANMSIWHTFTVLNKRPRHFEVIENQHVSKVKDAIMVEAGKERSLNDLSLSKDKAFESCQRDYLKRVAVNQAFGEEEFHLADSPGNKSCFVGSFGTRAVCTYSDVRRGFYWFGFHDRWSEFLKQGAESVAILVCADNQTAIFLPFKHLKARLKSTNKTRTWHHLKVQAEGLHLPKNSKDSFWNLAPYTREIVLPLASQSVSAT